MPNVPDNVSRRDFLRGTAAVAAGAAALSGGCAAPGSIAANALHPAKEADEASTSVALTHSARGAKLEGKIRVGLIGCGGRGRGAALDALGADPEVEIVALGDVFRDRVNEARGFLNEKAGERQKITDATCFDGLDNYKQVLGAGVDMVILATPPGFRPVHFEAAINAGKHVFMEKPVAVDPVGVRKVVAASRLAAQRGLGVVSGTQRRHQAAYLQAMERVRRGDIGQIVAAQCYWNQEGLWVKQREAGWSDMERQCRNWLYFTWLSGDHICEQHIHNLDVVNWALQATPVKCMGMGGRQARIGPEYGNVYDHFAIEYEYPGGVRVLSMCRQTEKASARISERIVGTKGVLYANGSTAEITGAKPWKYDNPNPPNPYVEEHRDLFASLRAGHPLNEGVQVAESTLTAIMGRMSAYTGRELSWKWVRDSSKLDLSPPSYTMGEVPVDPVAVPGQTELV